ncbi:division/cell wall cluster transcriptional repressor MraZ [Candidatus Uhrbacteria bacterium]|nr:division/cell wall cluster transcriptional repressor MraZ [Candidatus Uhrbacteria bacterium]
MLIGEYQHKMDAKRRLPMPARLRSELGPKVVVTRGLEGCLFVYPLRAWEEFAAKLNALPLTSESSRNFKRFMFSGASEVELDNLGRILVPDYLKDHAALQKDAVVLGAGERLEIWDKEKWRAHQTRTADEMEAHAEALNEFGI